MLRHVVIEGIDRLGKDTLIDGLKNRYGFFQEIHYEKPLVLDCIKEKVLFRYSGENYGKTLPEDELIKRAQIHYQTFNFCSMFLMLSIPNNPRIICNRAHLGETVYAPRYRGYSGDYVFDLEKQYNLDNTLLVLLHTSDFSFISDDGLSFDVTKREEEQEDFKRAFEKSNMKHKIAIDVCNQNGSFLDKDIILQSVCNRLESL